MRLILVFVIFFVSGCAKNYDVRSISDFTERGTPSSSQPDIVVGMVADSQFQNQENWSVRNDLRSKRKDKWVTNVTIRPPALVATARELLLQHLEQQRQRGVKAIFYLGDGANHGCRGELTRSDGTEQDGVFPTLRKFRSTTGIPIFYIIGNHDFLAAGNPSRRDLQESMCGGPGQWVDKAELIKLTHQFNEQSAIAADLEYHSSVSSDEWSSARCSRSQSAPISRLKNCYYAATVDIVADQRRYRFMLVDSNDYADVTSSKYPFAGQVEGTRGAMSFRNDMDRSIRSQTSWLVMKGRESQQEKKTPNVLVGLSHYDVPAFRKQIGPFVLSRKTQQLADIFVGENRPGGRKPFFLESAFFLSAHIHDTKMSEISTVITERRERILTIDELNIGSTTDYPSLSAVVRYSNDGQSNHMSYEPIRLPTDGCSKVLEELETTEFESFQGLESSGREAIFMSSRKPYAYRKLNGKKDRSDAVFRRINRFIQGVPIRAKCLGLEASSLEKTKDHYEW